MELEGTLELERPRTRRWVSIVAVTAPVVAAVVVAAWFIRAFIAPPIVTIPTPSQIAAALQVAARSEVPTAEPQQQPQQSPARAEEPAAPQRQASSPSPDVPTLSSLAAVPPTLASASSTVSPAPPMATLPSPSTTGAAAVAWPSTTNAYADPDQTPIGCDYRAGRADQGTDPAADAPPEGNGSLMRRSGGAVAAPPSGRGPPQPDLRSKSSIVIRCSEPPRLMRQALLRGPRQRIFPWRRLD